MVLVVIPLSVMLLVEWFQRGKGHGFDFGNSPRYKVVRWCIYLSTALLIIALQQQKVSPFIYFQF
jgi:hypothetical protein